MSGLSDDTLRKILTQIQGQAVASQKQLSIVKTQIQSKEKERKILTLTMRELAGVPQETAGEETRMYKAVGKMFLAQPRAEITSINTKSEKELSDDIANLQKKEKYLTKQFEEANSQLKDIFHSQQRAAAAQAS